MAKKKRKYKVFVWVPTKGWKLVGAHTDPSDALIQAIEFTPLEVKIAHLDGTPYHGGKLAIINYDLKYQPQLENFALRHGLNPQDFPGIA